MYTLEQMQAALKLLGLIQADAGKKYEVSYSVTGPAFHDTHLVLDRNDKPYVQIKPYEAKSHKKIILIADGDFKKQHPSQFELQLFHHLTAEFDIRVYQRGKTLEELLTCLTTEDFWNNVANVTGADESEVIDYLVKSHQQIQDYLVLDHHQYKNFLQKFYQNHMPKLELHSAQSIINEHIHLAQQAPHIFDISHLATVDFKTVFHGVIPQYETIAKRITTLVCHPLDAFELEKAKQLLPNLDTIIFTYITAQWFQHNITLYNDLNIVVKSFSGDEITLPTGLSLKSFTYGGYDLAIKLKIEKKVYINHLKLKTLIGNFNAKEIHQLKTLKLVKSLVELNLDHADIDEIILDHSTILTSLWKFDKVKHLTIRESNIRENSFISPFYSDTSRWCLLKPVLPQLETLAILSTSGNTFYTRDSSLHYTQSVKLSLNRNVNLKEVTASRELTLDCIHDLHPDTKKHINANNNLNLIDHLHHHRNDTIIAIDGLENKNESSNISQEQSVFYLNKKTINQALYNFSSAREITILIPPINTLQNHKNFLTTLNEFTQQLHAPFLQKFTLSCESFVDNLEWRNISFDCSKFPNLKELNLNLVNYQKPGQGGDLNLLTIDLNHCEQLQHLSISTSLQLIIKNISSIQHSLRRLRLNAVRAKDIALPRFLHEVETHITTIPDPIEPDLSCSLRMQAMQPFARNHIGKIEVALALLVIAAIVIPVALTVNNTTTPSDIPPTPTPEPTPTHTPAPTQAGASHPTNWEMIAMIAGIASGSTVTLLALVCIAIYLKRILRQIGGCELPTLPIGACELPTLPIQVGGCELPTLPNCFPAFRSNRSDRNNANQSVPLINKEFGSQVYESGRFVNAAFRRLNFKNQVTFEQNKLVFSTESTLKKINPVILPFGNQIAKLQQLKTRVVEGDGDEALTEMQGLMKRGIYYVIESSQPLIPENLISIYCDHPEDIELFQNNQMQLCVKLKSQTYLSFSSQLINLLCHYKIDKEYDHKAKMISNIAKEQVTNNNVKLPDELQQLLSSTLNQDQHPLHFLTNNTLLISDKISRLFYHFKNATIHADKNLNRLQNLLDVMEYNQGTSEDIAEACYVLLAFIKVDSVIFYNHYQHWVEIVNNGKFSRIDYNKTFVPVEETPRVSSKQPQPLQEVVIDIHDISNTQFLVSSQETIKMQKVFEHYKDCFRTKGEITELTELNDIFVKKGNQSPLILASNTSVDDVNKVILNHVMNTHHDTVNHHLFIDDPQKPIQFYKPLVISNGGLVEGAGVLQKLVESGEKVTLVLNINNFKMANFQSMLDADPFLNIGTYQVKLNKTNITVVCIASVMPKSDAFNSRCRHYSLHPNLLTQSSTLIRNENAKQEERMEIAVPLKVDLTGLINWSTVLLGKINSGETIQFKEGILYQALNENRELIIVNAPEYNPKFLSLVKQINDEGKFYDINGQMRVCGDKFKLKLINEDISLANNNIFMLGTSTNTHESFKMMQPQPDTTRKPIYIGLQNFYELFERNTVNKNGRLQSLPGYLATYDHRTHYFHLIGDMPFTFWQAIVSHIKLNHSAKAFDFKLAPNASIEKVFNTNRQAHSASTVNVSAVTNTDENVIVTNDPDFLADLAVKQNNKDDIVVIHVDEKTDFNELVVKIAPININKLEYQYQVKAMLNYLIEGKTVVLCGNISNALLQQLTPLLAIKDNHLFECYGREFKLKENARLMIFTNSAKLHLKNYHDLATCHFSFEDYVTHFKKLDPANEERLMKIKEWHGWIDKLPHRTQPPRPYYSHARLALLLKTLADSMAIHKHHPLKGHLDYYYPARDRDYLGVIGKLIFKANDDSPIRYLKLHEIIESNYINSANSLQPHIWSVLNCLRGKAITEIFKGKLNDAINTTTYPFTIKSTYLENIWKLISKELREHPKNNLIPTNKYEMNAQKSRALLSSANKAIGLMGEPGIGKTKLTSELIGNTNNKSNWLSTSDNFGEPIAYVVDEFNLTMNSRKNIVIREIHRQYAYDENKGVVPISNSHVFVGTCNEFQLSFRQFVPAFYEYGEIFYFKSPTDSTFKTKLRKLLQPLQLDASADLLLQACRLFEKFNPHYVLSFRDIGNLAYRYIFLANRSTAADAVTLNKVAFAAAVYEFTYSLHHQQEREAFNAQLVDLFGFGAVNANTLLPINPAYKATTDGLIELNNQFTLSQNKIYVFELVLQALFIRLDRMVSEHLPDITSMGRNLTELTAKNCLTLVGDSGVGKSSILREAFIYYQKSIAVTLKSLEEKSDLSPIDQARVAIIKNELGKQPFNFNVGSTDIEEILQEAFNAHAILFADEANTDNTEAKMNKYLDGKDIPNASHTHKAGFFVFETKNTGKEPDRYAETGAAINRRQEVAFDNYTHTELMAEARFNKIEYPELFVDAFMAIMKHYPHINPRTFRSVIKEEIARRQPVNTAPGHQLLSPKAKIALNNDKLEMNEWNQKKSKFE